MEDKIKILFSPIGKSDPINHDIDGPWLHVCRHLRPALTVLFLSQEMDKREQSRHMYTRALELLNQKLIADQTIEQPIAYELCRHPELDDPSAAEKLFPLFERELMALSSQYPNAQIYLNVNSGTPAMKSCLEILYHLLPCNLFLCRVPIRRDKVDQSNSGIRDDVPDDADIEKYWKEDEDNKPGTACRLSIISREMLTPLGRRLELHQVKSLIMHHEYYAAKLALESMNALPEASALAMALNGAVYRQQLNIRNAGIQLKKSGWNYADLLAKRASEKVFIASEGILTMQLALDRGDASDMLRRLTPVYTYLMRVALEKSGVDLKKVERESNDTQSTAEKIDPQKLQQEYPELYTGLSTKDSGKDIFVNTSVLCSLVQCSKASNSVKNDLKYLRNIETQYRNPAAHELIFTKFSEAPELMKRLWNIVNELGGAFDKAYRHSYTAMSEFIVELVEA